MSSVHGPDFGPTDKQSLGFFTRLDWRAGRRFRLSGYRGLMVINPPWFHRMCNPFSRSTSIDRCGSVEERRFRIYRSKLPSSHGRQRIPDIHRRTRNDRRQKSHMLVEAAFQFLLTLVQTLVMLIILWLPVKASWQVVLNLAAKENLCWGA